ncbi:hypothetical protein HUU05_22160 [candidate division KSB1 bacterium]|nr:hypothetical protein [candidate division KSB1 bacterium]
MLSIVLSDLEKQISLLSRQEQLWLIEKLVRRLREVDTNGNSAKATEFDDQLALMASDPEMQSELKQIEQEFLVTEMDGLR